ncbi:MAG: MFS transporter, partial [Lachnospiraceae bacterium]|nr:MFS transporter [Lachnospiraceae bacterium]
MKTTNVKTVKPFGMKDKMGYLFGDFGNDFTFILSTMILTKFYTDVMGISAAVIGTIMMLARFVDAVTDVAMGRICDRCKVTPNGKFKPWLLRMCIPVSVASFLMYQSGLAGLPTNVKIIYLAITYILWGSFCYTGINIPYGSMASAISSEPGDRQSLSTFRTMGGMLAGMVIGILLPLIAYEKITLADGTVKETLIGSRVTLAAGIFSVLAILCYLLCYKLITERVVVESNGEKAPSVGQMLKSAFTNR